MASVYTSQRIAAHHTVKLAPKSRAPPSTPAADNPSPARKSPNASTAPPPKNALITVIRCAGSPGTSRPKRCPSRMNVG